MVVELTRRPLKTLAEISLAEPYKADRVTNRLRALLDKFNPRRSAVGRSAYNRKERANYRKRMPQAQDARRQHPADTSGPKRKAPEKRLGKRLRRR